MRNNSQSAMLIFLWNQGIVYCTCGHLLRETESSRHIHQWQLDILSQSRTMSSRRGDLMVLGMVKLKHRKHFIAHNLRKRCIKKNFEGHRDRFQKDLRCRDSHLKVGRIEEKCIQMDELAQQDFTYRPSPEDFERCKKTRSTSLNTSGRNAPMKLRSDFSEALTKLHRPHRESGEERLAPIHFYQYQKWRPSSSSSSTSWWQWNDHRWSSQIHRSQFPLSS